MRFPVDDPYKITTYFNKATHPGIDIAPIPAGSLGVAFHAPERSKVIANSTGKIEGNYIKLQGLDSGKYYYAGHFARTFVIVGTIVQEGEVLATLGQTGQATGVHTHFEVRTTSTGGQIDPLSINWTGGGNMETTKVDQGALNMLFPAFTGFPPTPAQSKAFVGKYWADVVHTLEVSEAHKKHVAEVAMYRKAWETLDKGFEQITAFVPKKG